MYCVQLYIYKAYINYFIDIIIHRIPKPNTFLTSTNEQLRHTYIYTYIYTYHKQKQNKYIHIWYTESHVGMISNETLKNGNAAIIHQNPIAKDSNNNNNNSNNNSKNNSKPDRTAASTSKIKAIKTITPQRQKIKPIHTINHSR